MTHFHRILSVKQSAAVVLAVVTVLAGYRTFAHRPEPIQPAVIAVFDLERTFNSLKVKEQADAELAALAEQFKAKTDSKSKTVEQLETDLEDHLPGSERHRDLQDQLSLAVQEYRAEVEHYRSRLERERARTLRQIYLDIRAVVRSIAEENGYAVVFVDDSIAEIPLGTEQEIGRHISSRRIAYASPELDITNEIIARMNQGR